VASTEYLTTKEAARQRNVTIKYIYDLLALGRLPGARKVGRVWLIPVEVGAQHKRRAKRD
jgi:excisionase family DNA binding protein